MRNCIKGHSANEVENHCSKQRSALAIVVMGLHQVLYLSSLALFLPCVRAHACVLVLMCDTFVCICMQVSVEARSQFPVSPSIALHLYILRQDLSVARNQIG